MLIVVGLDSQIEPMQAKVQQCPATRTQIRLHEGGGVLSMQQVKVIDGDLIWRYQHEEAQY